MSYYHPSLARHQPTMTAEMVPTQSIHAPHQLDHDVSIPGQPRVASVKGALAAELAATLVSPSATSAPLAMPARSGGGRPAAAGGAGVGAKKNKNLNKVPQRLNAAQQLMWADHLCNYPPMGSCARLLATSSTYCAMHSCRAINDDGDRCRNLVLDSTEGRYCKNGWHNETSTYSYVEDLKVARKAYDTIVASERDAKFAEHATYFLTHFPSALISSIQSTSSSNSAGQSSSRGSPLPRTPHISNDPKSDNVSVESPAKSKSISLENETGWGAYGVDKWWVGEWKVDSVRSFSTSFTSNSSGSITPALTASAPAPAAAPIAVAAMTAGVVSAAAQ